MAILFLFLRLGLDTKKLGLTKLELFLPRVKTVGNLQPDEKIYFKIPFSQTNLVVKTEQSLTARKLV